MLIPLHDPVWAGGRGRGRGRWALGPPEPARRGPAQLAGPGLGRLAPPVHGPPRPPRPGGSSPGPRLPTEAPSPRPGPPRGQEYQLGQGSQQSPRRELRLLACEAAENWAPGQGEGPARPSSPPGAPPSALILTDGAPVPAWQRTTSRGAARRGLGLAALGANTPEAAVASWKAERCADGRGSGAGCASPSARLAQTPEWQRAAAAPPNLRPARPAGGAAAVGGHGKR